MQDLIERLWRGNDYYLPPHGLLILISSRTQKNLHWSDTTQNMLGLPLSTTNKEIIWSLRRHFLSQVSHLLDIDSLCQINIKVPAAQWE